MINNIIFDFDSTIINAEGVELIILEALGRVEETERTRRLKILNDYTDKATNGDIPLAEAMHERFALAEVHRYDVEAVAAKILDSMNAQVRETFYELQKAGKRVFVFSTGFDELVRPITKELHIDDDHVFTNQLIYDFGGRVVGINERNPLFLSVGKGYLAEQLRIEGRLQGGTAVVGDGTSDLAMRRNNVAQMFVYYSGSFVHEDIRRMADFSIDRFDQLLPLFFSEDEFSNEQAKSIGQATNGEPPSLPKVILLENIHEEAVARLEKQALELETVVGAWTEGELCAGANRANILGIRSQTHISEKVIACLPGLWAIGAYCIGTNQIDLEAAASAGIPVFNAPYSNTRSVAELVVGEIIMLMRHVFEKSQAAHEGKWLKSALGCTEIRGKTVGIIGYGHIGTQVSVMLESLGMSVIFHDIVDKLPLGNAQCAAGLDELLKQADVVTLHVPDTPETRGMIGRAQIKKIKSGAFLINSSRGRVVDLTAVRDALNEKHLAGAAIDVFPAEPGQPEDDFATPLQGARNVILTPHIGGSTQEAQVTIAHYVSEKLIRFLTTGATTGAVNFPEVELPRVPGTHRILHIHHNVPGVLAKINSVLARRSINVASQMLQTKDAIGYLAVDVDEHVSDHVLELMGHITETVKVRKIS